MSQSLNERYFFLIFILFETEVLKWNFTSINVDVTKTDKYQKVCKYLNALRDSEKNIDNYDFKKL
jgi:hypothetical protein